jgi:hypothetical protein
MDYVGVDPIHLAHCRKERRIGANTGTNRGDIVYKLDEFLANFSRSVIHSEARFRLCKFPTGYAC